MYEVELRALVKDFNSVKNKISTLAQNTESDSREVTVFMFNPHKEDFELRLRLQKNRAFLNFKESMDKTARKEIESDVANPSAMYELLLNSGFKIKQIIARTKYSYKHDKFDILLNRIAEWGDAIEVERCVENEENAEKIESEIKEFMTNNLGIPELLSKETLKKMNVEYQSKIDFNKISIIDLIDYVNHRKEDIKFISRHS